MKYQILQLFTLHRIDFHDNNKTRVIGTLNTTELYNVHVCRTLNTTELYNVVYISPMFQPQTFPDLQDKVEGLHQAISTHQGMEASETDAVLFGKIKSVTPRPSTRRTSRLLRTPDRYTSTVEPLYNGHLGTNLCGRCVEVAIVKWFQ